ILAARGTDRASRRGRVALLVYPLVGPDHGRAHVLHVVYADVAVDRSARHAPEPVPDDVERALRADLLDYRVLERELDLIPDRGIASAVVYAKKVGRNHRLGARPGRRVVRRHERREVVGAGEVILVWVIADVRLLQAQERAGAAAELAIRRLLHGRPRRLGRDARPV